MLLRGHLTPALAVDLDTEPRTILRYLHHHRLDVGRGVHRHDPRHPRRLPDPELDVGYAHDVRHQRGGDPVDLATVLGLPSGRITHAVVGVEEIDLRHDRKALVELDAAES